MPNFDLMVVGAGVLGTFHAYHALNRGLRVLLVEKNSHPAGATVRNFGQAVPSGLSSDWFEYGRRSAEIYRQIQQEFDITVRNNGSVYIASDEQEQQLLHELKQKMDERDYEAHLLSAKQITELWPALKSDYCKEGLFFPQELSVEPENMIHRLIDHLKTRFRNLTYSPSTAVISCQSSGSDVEITTGNNDKITAGKAIICNGSEFKILFPELFKNSGIVVSKLQMMQTVPMPEVKLEGNILTGLTIRRYESFQECPSFLSFIMPDNLTELKKWGIHILFKKATDGSIIIGDSHEYAPVGEADCLGFSIKQSINELMLNEAQRMVNFNVRRLSATWAGFYSQHPEKDIVPYDIEDRIHIRTAIGGKGITTSAGYTEENIKQLYS